MLLRIMFFALMAMGLAGLGGVAWITTRPSPAAQAAVPAVVPKTNIIVAAREVRAGSLVKVEDIAAKAIATTELTADASVDTPESRRSLVGAMVRHSLTAGDIVHEGDLLHPGDHGFLAAVLGPGMRAVTVGVDAVTGSAGLIWPGDRVDLILTQTLSEANQPVGRRVAAETVLSDTRVIAIDHQLVQGGDAGNANASQARTVTLEVSQEQAERVSVAVRLGKLSLSVRSAEAMPAGRRLAAAPNTTWASDVSPALTGNDAPPPTQSMIRVFQGAGDAKEFKF
jgi:pilus assembly protein CpaB